MFRRIAVTVALVASVALGLAASAGAAVPAGQQNWQATDWQTATQPKVWTLNTDFKLRDNFSGHLLGYGERHPGVDLQWREESSDWIMRIAGDHRTRPVAQGDRVALYNFHAHKYLAYGHQDFGVDLVWVSKPSYEWQIAGTGTNRGLYNDRARDYLQSGERTWGINLVWNFREIGGVAVGVDPPDLDPAPAGPQVSYVTLGRLAAPGPFHETYLGTLSFGRYHRAVVDEVQNTSQYPISFVGYESPYPDHCHGSVLGVGQRLSGPALAALTRDQPGSLASYTVRSCGAAGGTSTGAAPLVRITYHYTS